MLVRLPALVRQEALLDQLVPLAVPVADSSIPLSTPLQPPFVERVASAATEKDGQFRSHLLISPIRSTQIKKSWLTSAAVPSTYGRIRLKAGRKQFRYKRSAPWKGGR